MECIMPPANGTHNATAHEASAARSAYAWIADSVGFAAASDPPPTPPPLPPAALSGYVSRALLETPLDAELWRGAPLPPFTYYDAPHWSSGVAPIGGPVRGGTRVEMYGGDSARAAFAVVAAALWRALCRRRQR